MVAAGSVAESLADLATDPVAVAPDAPIAEIAGPRPENLVDMAEVLVARRAGALRVEAVSDAVDPNRELNESGGLLPGPYAMLAGPTFEEWLASLAFDEWLDATS